MLGGIDVKHGSERLTYIKGTSDEERDGDEDEDEDEDTEEDEDDLGDDARASSDRSIRKVVIISSTISRKVLRCAVLG